MLPDGGLMLHVTVVTLVPVTAALNRWPCPADIVTGVGVTVTVTVTGLSVMMVLAVCVGSATLVAVIVTVCLTVIKAGAAKVLDDWPPAVGPVPAPKSPTFAGLAAPA